MYAIRQARSRELPRLVAIEHQAAELFRDVGLPDVADMDAHPVEELEEARAAGRLFVVDDGFEPVGFALLTQVDGLPHLHELAVDPDHGRRGLGRRLVEYACEAARQQGFAAITLCTFRDVPFNGPFYARLGFRPVPEASLTPGLVRLRRKEAEDGLDVSKRDVMRRVLVNA